MGTVPDTPSLPATSWTAVRIEIRAWLRRNAPSLAELYEGAVEILFERRVPGWVRLASHAVREIANGLPSAIVGTTGGRGRSTESTEILNSIANDWEKHNLSFDASTFEQGIPSDLGASVRRTIEIPRQLAQYIAANLRMYRQASETREAAAIRLFEACAPENEQARDMLRPIIRHWLETLGWFMRWVHDSGKVDADTDEAEFVAKFETFEASLSALSRGFFTTMDELDEILEDTNA